MRSYRCFFRDNDDRIRRVETVDAETGKGALVKAVTVAGERSAHCVIEAWDWARRAFPLRRERVDVELLKRVLHRAGLIVLEDLPGPPMTGGERRARD